MKPQDVFWGGLAATGTAFELWALHTKRDDLTLSRVTRRALKCHTRPGRAAALLIIGGGAATFANHLLNLPVPTVPLIDPKE